MIKRGEDCKFWEEPDKTGFHYCDNHKARVNCARGPVEYGCWQEKENPLVLKPLHIEGDPDWFKPGDQFEVVFDEGLIEEALKGIEDDR